MVTYIDIHTHKCGVGTNIVLYNLKSDETPDYKYLSYGIHPWDLRSNAEDTLLNKLTNYCQNGKIIALGEIGIDRAIEFPLHEQIIFFEQQHILAEKYNLPVIIHCVKAWSDFLSLRNRLKPTIPWIFHGYNGNAFTAQQLVNKGCYLSFGQLIMESVKIQEVFKALPINKLFLETDDSEEKIENIYQKAADLRHIDLLDLKKQIDENFCKVFAASKAKIC